MAINPDYTFEASLVRVIDGDTFDLELNLGFYVSKTIRFRLKGANAAELYGVKHETPEHEAGQVAKKAAETWLVAQKELRVRTYKSRRTFGRWVADIENQNGESLAEALIANGFARRADANGNDIERREK